MPRKQKTRAVAASRRHGSGSSASSGKSSSSGSSSGKSNSSQGSLTRAMTRLDYEGDEHVISIAPRSASGVTEDGEEAVFEVSGIIVRDEKGEYYVPQTSVFINGDFDEDRVKINAKHTHFMKKVKKTKYASHHEFYRFKIETTHPIKITKVSGIDRSYSGQNIYKAIRDAKKIRKDRDV